jgi:hypothetical protein
MRDIGRKIVGDNELHETFVRPLYLAERVLTQTRVDGYQDLRIDGGKRS